MLLNEAVNDRVLLVNENGRLIERTRVRFCTRLFITNILETLHVLSRICVISMLESS